MGLFPSRRVTAWVASATLLAATMTAGVVPASAAAASACRVTVVDGATFPALQAAIDAAPVNGRIKVKGICVGHASIRKSLTLVGTGGATVVGSVSVDGPSGVVTTVLIRGLTVDGRVGVGGGSRQTTPPSITTLQDVDMESLIAGSGATVVLAGRTSVSGSAGNAVWVSYAGGELILNDHASVHHNGGCGITGTDARPVILNDSSSIHHNAGCGISLEGYSVILNDRSSIHHNGGDGVFSYHEGRQATCNDRSSVHHNLYGIRSLNDYYSDRDPTITGCVAGDNVHDNLIEDIYILPPL